MEATPDTPRDMSLTLFEDKPARTLTPGEIRRIGALTVQDERVAGLTDFLHEQEDRYSKMDKASLVDELVRRDKHLALEGRQLADGRLAGNLLRELVRHLLTLSDHATIRKVGDASKAGQIEGILLALGAEPAALQDVKRYGTTLGSGQTPEERAAEFERLASGELAHNEDPTQQARPDVADQVRAHRERNIPAAEALPINQSRGSN